jgi:hypothetical protein
VIIRVARRASISSSSLVMIPTRSTRNVPAPTSLMMTSPTYEFIPWMSDTTAMIDITATMFPSTIMNERSLFAQMDESAMPTASKI